jgi:hypothetical protein
MKVVEILEKSLRHLQYNGWMQGSYGPNEKGAYCAIGHIGQVCCRHGLSVSTQVRAENYVMAATGDTSPRAGALAVWNDTPYRSKEEVIAAFKLAIKRARRRHRNGG